MRVILALAVAGFGSSVSLRSVEPMLPDIAAHFAIPLPEAALLASAYGYPYALIQPFLGPVAEAVSKNRVIKVSLAVLTIALSCSAVAPGFTSLLITRIAAGAVSGGIFPMAVALVGDRTTLAERQVGISRILVASIFGQMFGASASGLLVAILGWRAVFALLAALTGSAWLFVSVFLRSTDEVASKFNLGRILDGYRAVIANPMTFIVFGAVTCEGLSFFSVFPFTAAMFLGRGGSGSFEAGIALGAFAVGGMLYAALVRPLIAILGQWGMMRAGGLAAGFAYLAIAAPIGWIAASFCFLIAGFGFYMLHNTLQTRGTELAPSARASTFALFSACMFFGQGSAPVIGGAIFHAAGSNALFLASGSFIIVLGFVAAQLVKRHA